METKPQEGQLSAPRLILAEEVAKKFHENYEKLAPSYGYTTREATARPWESLPPENKGLMIATAGEVLDWLGVLGLHIVFDGTEIVVSAKPERPQKAQRPAPPVLVPVITTHRPSPIPAITSPETKVTPEVAKTLGYTGNICETCQGTRMTRAGKCEKCEDCGSSSGCS